LLVEVWQRRDLEIQKEAVSAEVTPQDLATDTTPPLWRSSFFGNQSSKLATRSKQPFLPRNNFRSGKGNQCKAEPRILALLKHGKKGNRNPKPTERVKK
jgi:hypothetical protein